MICNTDGSDNTSIYRVDLLSDIFIHDRNKKKGNKGTKAKEISKVRGIEERMEMNEFMLKRPNMFYGQSTGIRIKLRKDRYTRLHDSFGNNYQYIREPDKEHDEVSVECVPEAMTSWVLQNFDCVEVLAPKDIREAVQKRIAEMADGYGRYRYG